MKTLILIFIFSTICLGNWHSDNDKLIKQTKSLILKIFNHPDINPSHQQEADNIFKKFQEILLNRNSENAIVDHTSEVTEFFAWMYKNGMGEYEDSPDVRRKKVRQALSFASIALLSDYDKVYTFLEHAKLSLMERIVNPNLEFMEEKFLGILLIEIVLKLEENNLNKSEIEKLNSFLEINKETISEAVYLDTKDLLAQCSAVINKK